MPTAKVYYKGDLKTELIHELSGEGMTTDAPPDNRGKGRSFSPTDLLASSWLSCMLTIMAMRAEDEGLDLKGTKGYVEKNMQNTPRKIKKLKGVFFMPFQLSQQMEEKLRNAAKGCPVSQSLSETLDIEVIFQYEEASSQ